MSLWDVAKNLAIRLQRMNEIQMKKQQDAANGGEEEKKQNQDDVKSADNDRFNLKILGRGGRMVMIRNVTKSWRISEVKSGYIDETGIGGNSARNLQFNYNGQRMQEYRTLEYYGITNNHHSPLSVVYGVQGGGGDYGQQIQEEIQAIASSPAAPRERVFELAKQKFRQEGKPVIIDTKDALSDIKQNAANYKNVALPMTLAMDKDFSTWNEQSFKRDFAIKFNVPIECIEVVSVRAGSIIADVKLHTHWKTKDGKNKSMNIEVIADAIDFKKAEKAFAEFAIFAIEFGLPTAGFDCSRLKVIMNPRWNRGYGPGATDWDGPLEDGKSRGGEPYYCPKGWKRFAIQFEESALDFAGTYDKWPIAYHGTKFDFSMMITLSGLRCSKGDPPFGAHGPGVYLSPSIKYVSHPRYCKPIKLDLSKQEWKNHGVKQDQIDDFRSYDGKWVQCAFMVRVKPGSYRKCRETMGLGTSGKFDNIEKNVIEWIVDGPEGTIIGNEKILIYGIMIRARDTRQTSYQDYE